MEMRTLKVCLPCLADHVYQLVKLQHGWPSDDARPRHFGTRLHVTWGFHPATTSLFEFAAAPWFVGPTRNTLLFCAAVHAGQRPRGGLCCGIFRRLSTRLVFSEIRAAAVGEWKVRLGRRSATSVLEAIKRGERKRRET